MTLYSILAILVAGFVCRALRRRGCWLQAPWGPGPTGLSPRTTGPHQSDRLPLQRVGVEVLRGDPRHFLH